MRLSARMRLASSLTVAAGLHAAALLLLSGAPDVAMALPSLDVSVVERRAEEPPPAPPAPPPPPPSRPPPAIAEPSRARPTRHASAAPMTATPGEATRAPAAADDRAGDLATARAAAAEVILTRLGTPREGGAQTGDEGGDASAAPVTLPVRLADYAHARTQYPDQAIDALASGQVLLELDVDAHGAVRDVEVRGHIGYGFDELAAKLARDYRFRPARDREGRDVAMRIGWRMTFAKWQPGGGPSAPTASALPSGVVALGSSAEPRGGDRPGSPPEGQPAHAKARPLPVAEVAARPVGALDETERHELCRWQIKLRGGVHPETCYGGPTREDELTNMVGRGDGDSNGGHWVREDGDATTMSRHVSKDRPGDEVMVFVKPELECVAETHTMDGCGVTVGQYTECMTKLAQRPCEWKRIPACFKISQACR